MTDKMREAATQALEALEKHCTAFLHHEEAYVNAIIALRTALAEQPAEQEPVAVACQISALGDSWADFPLERAQEAIEHGLNVRYLGVLRQKPVKPAEQSASQGEPVTWTPRELELIDGMIEVQLHHAAQCDRIANRTMAEKQKGWDMERVALLRKIRDTAPQPAKRESLTDFDIADRFYAIGGAGANCLRYFAAGVRYAEADHGIGGGK